MNYDWIMLGIMVFPPMILLLLLEIMMDEWDTWKVKRMDR